MLRRFQIVFALVFLSSVCVTAAETEWHEIGPSRGDDMLEVYFAAKTAELTRNCLSDIKTLEDWQNRKETYRQQLFEMLGLQPLPDKTPLKATVTGKVEHADITVEQLHFQSRPGLYVTGNLYVPKQRQGRLPAILYVCGHARAKIDGVSYGNKTSYQHHGGWFARNGFVCLTIDTLQLGEIEGIHHGTCRENMWWWNARGYSSAGAEAWNCIRALDYLQQRPEVDPERLGVTGRSGGGAYSWWVAALDERIKAAVPVAGITSLKNHVVDGCVEGHCDCMYMVNTHRWDFPIVAALVAPRSLLISNTDKDRIFPLDGVVDVYTKARRIYELHDKPGNIGLHICEGPHKDTQELRIHAFHWFNKVLKKQDPLIEMAATKLFTPQQLKVFDTLPDDQENTTIQETFTKIAIPPTIQDTKQWDTQKERWMSGLSRKVFGGWPSNAPATDGNLTVRKVLATESKGIQLAAYDFTSELPNVTLRLFLVHRTGLAIQDAKWVELTPMDEQGWTNFVSTMRPEFASQLGVEPDPEAGCEEFEHLAESLATSAIVKAYFAPRGIGPTEWNTDPRKRTHIRRRFVLLGQTRDGMRVWDVARAVSAIRAIPDIDRAKLRIRAHQEMAGIALYASLFTPSIEQLDLWQLPHSHHDGPIFLNVLRLLDLPQTVAMAAERSQVVIHQDEITGWEYAEDVAQVLGWAPDQLQVRSMKAP